MNGLNLVTCGCCGWVHMGVSLDHAYGETMRFMEAYEQMSPEHQGHYGDVSFESTMFQYLHCLNCGAFCTNMREFSDGDLKSDGVTINPIAAHGQLVFDTAELDELRIENHLLERAAALINRGLTLSNVPALFADWLKDYKKHGQTP